MKRTMRRACCGAALGLLAATWGAAAAPTPGSAEAKSAPTAAAVCLGCHGAHGEGVPAANIPRLAGQWADYLDKQLRDYASGARQNPVMQNFAKPLSDEDRASLATYFASLTAPYAAQTLTVNAAQLARGHQIAHQGIEVERVQACDNCHGPDGSGVQHAAPYLAGQSAGYLASALKAWQQGTRKNDAGKLMASVVGQLTDADITAVTAYFAGLETPSK
jgi:cytochrome c553